MKQKIYCFHKYFIDPSFCFASLDIFNCKFSKYYRKKVILLVICCCFISSCSIKKVAINSFANSLSEGSSVFATDDDPQLVKEALPFALKTMEILLHSTPDNENLLLAALSGFVQYTHAFVVMPANELEFIDYDQAKKEKERAKKLFLRARAYGFKVLDLRYPGFCDNILKDPENTLKKTIREDVPALYWTGAAWGSALSVAKDNMSLVGDLPAIEALMKRALVLDEAWGNGTIHEFFIVFNGGDSAEFHFDRAMELNKKKSISPLVSFAESVCVKQQDVTRFKTLLNEAASFDVDKYPEYRLANTMAQKKAEFLLAHLDYYFLE